MPNRTRNPYRLDRNVLPSFYSIHLEPDLKNFTFKGHETIRVAAKKEFSKITLHALELKIKSASLKIRERTFSVKKISYDKKFETVILDFGKKIPAAKEALLSIAFDGALNDKMHGFYRTSYMVDERKEWGAATQFEATDARRAFPCWDEPDIKAKFEVTLKVPSALTALSNMPVAQEKKIGALKELCYEPTPVMSTYLLCFVIADLDYVEGKDKNGVLIRIYTTKGKKEQGKFALDVTQHALPYFSEWFDIPYALPKCDMVALPDFASGAMENWGLITYRETALLVDPKNSSASARQRVAEVIDHELAHQWFGNLVTMEWWTDLWLNEGFASYMGPKAVDHQFPEWKIWSQFLSTEYLAALRDDSLKNSHPIEIDVKNPHEIREIFDHITYAKGSSVNRMLEHYLTEEVFRKGLRVYLKRYAYQNATTLDLWGVLEEVSKKPIRAIMASFTRQEGYPLLSAEDKNGKLVLSQKRFLYDGSKDPKKLRWNIPVTVRNAKDAVESFSMKELVLKTKTDSASIVKINPDQSGFYRTKYSPEFYERLTARLGNLNDIDRLGVLDDAFSLVRTGELKTTVLLKMLTALKKENDYNVWLTMSGILGSVEHILSPESIPALHRFADGLLDSVRQSLGWEKRSEDSHLDILLRSLVLSRSGHHGHAPTINEARSRFEAFADGEALEADLRGAVYGIAAEHGNGKEFEKLLAIYKKSGLQEEKVRILRSLTRFKNKDVIHRVLSFALTPDVRPQDTYVVLASFGGNPAAREINWQHLKKEWKKISRLYSGGSIRLLGHIMEGAASGFTGAKELKDVEAFFKSHPIQGTERGIRQTLEAMRATIAWKKRDQAEIEEFLKG